MSLVRKRTDFALGERIFAVNTEIILKQNYLTYIFLISCYLAILISYKAHLICTELLKLI